MICMYLNIGKVLRGRPQAFLVYIAFYIYCSACLVKSFRLIIPDHLQLSPSKSLIILYPTCLYRLARYVYVCVHQNPLTCFGASFKMVFLPLQFP